MINVANKSLPVVRLLLFEKLTAICRTITSIFVYYPKCGFQMNKTVKRRGTSISLTEEN
jgi:hypothetical protein